MEYKDIPRMTRQQIVSRLRGGDNGQMAEALLSAAIFDPDRDWVEQECISWLTSGNSTLAVTAAKCLGHLARIHGMISSGAHAALLAAETDHHTISGEVADALDDIRLFAKIV